MDRELGSWWARPQERIDLVMLKRSAGILLYRFREGNMEVLLVHPGGPFWAKKDEGAWSIPKGEHGEGEDPLEAAKRELAEETGVEVKAHLIELGELRQPSGKIVRAWAAAQDLDPSKIRSNTFEMEWPPHSGRRQEFPEIDRGAWYTAAAAQRKLHKGQAGFIKKLTEKLGHPGRLKP
jgi:predicted NUDIX family NTP pyrophosphohydrolase